VRVLPGDTTAEALERLRRIVSRHGVEARVAHPDSAVEASAESPVDHEGWRSIVSALGESFPDAAALAFLFSAGTDSKHYRHIVRAIYRFTPLVQTKEDIARIHGRDEKVELGNLRRCAHFYRSLISSL
jgi:carboxypeptidase PM20D1